MPLIDNYLLDNYRLDGPDIEKYATGEIAARDGLGVGRVFKSPGDQTTSLSFATVNRDFGFVPKIVTIRVPNLSDMSVSLITSYVRDFKNSNGDSYSLSQRGGGIYEAAVSDTPSNSGSTFFYVNKNGFRLHFSSSNPPYPLVWEAFG